MRSGPGEARTILLFHIISARPSKQPLMVRTFLKVYVELLFFVSARTNKRHHHQIIALKEAQWELERWWKLPHAGPGGEESLGWVGGRRDGWMGGWMGGWKGGGCLEGLTLMI